MLFVDKFFPIDKEKESAQLPLFSYKRLLAFFVTFLQVCILYSIISNFNIEKNSGIKEAWILIVVSFFINAFSSLRYRQFILFATCIALIYLAFGFIVGSVFILLALLIIGCCIVPINLWLRTFLIICAFIILFILRIELIYAIRLSLISPYIASMFMFRVIIFMYEIKHGLVPKSIWECLTYFFMFPNICFLFFPVIDYKTYRKTYYNISDILIWQKGIRWMLRGIIHILAYRIVYYYFLIGSAQVVDITTLFQYMVASFALVLRLSGLFHFILGLLCLFGLNLPESFNNYFLATTFTSLWQRINIYWKDFVLKLFFYPLLFKLKKRTKYALPLTMILVFIISWLLHAYQWFWIRGFYVFNYLDLSFWLILGTCVTISAVIQEKKSQIPFKQKSIYVLSLENSLKMVGIFLFMSVAWSFWGSTSFRDWIYLISMANNYNFHSIAKVFLIVFGVIVICFFTHLILQNNLFSKLINLPAHRTLFLSFPSLLILALISSPKWQSYLPAKLVPFILVLSDEKLNDSDKEKSEQNYYRKMIDHKENGSTGLWEANLKRPFQEDAMDDIYVRTNNLLTKTFVANKKVYVNGKQVSTNSFGLRDKQYSFNKQNKTLRIALLGGSYEMGSGVADTEVYEAIVETNLNKYCKDSTITNFEILNFACSGFYLIQHVELCNTKVFNYSPNAVMYIAHTDERKRIIISFADLISEGKDLKYPLLNYIKNITGAKQVMSKTELISLLTPFADVLIKWSYIQLSNRCHQNNAIPIWVFLPTTECIINLNEFNYLEKTANECGFIKLNLTNVYGNYKQEALQIASWDTHPNTLGHKLIASKLFEKFLQNKKNIETQLKK